MLLCSALLCSVPFRQFQAGLSSALLHHHHHHDAFLSSFLPSRPPKAAKGSKRGKSQEPQEQVNLHLYPLRTQLQALGAAIRRRRGMGSGSLLKVLAKNFDVLAGPLVALAYPLYASIKAIETKSPVDDQQWLTYWVLYSLIALVELTFASIIEWLPFWSSMKLIFICWLVLPYFNGAAYVYQNYVRPVFVKNQMVNIWYVPQKKGIFGKSDDFLTALDKFIEENGAEALKKLANKAGKSSKQARKSSKDSKESKSSKELKEPNTSKDAKQPKPPKESKPSKDSKEQKKAQKDTKEQKKALKDTKEQKKALKDTKEQKKALQDSKELKKALKDSKELDSLKDSGEPKPKSNKRVTFAEVEPEKEFKASSSDWHPTSDYHSTYPEHNSWNSSFMIFEDENSYWNQSPLD